MVKCHFLQDLWLSWRTKSLTYTLQKLVQAQQGMDQSRNNSFEFIKHLKHCKKIPRDDSKNIGTKLQKVLRQINKCFFWRSILNWSPMAIGMLEGMSRLFASTEDLTASVMIGFNDSQKTWNQCGLHNWKRTEIERGKFIVGICKRDFFFKRTELLIVMSLWNTKH